MNPFLFLGSLVAILALAGFARWLKLGHAPRLATEAEARAAAAEAIDDFEPVRIALDHQGHGALLQDGTGRLLLLKPHGNFFAGRLLTGASRADHQTGHGRTGLRIDSGERRFGAITLQLDDPAYWADAIKRLGSPGNA